MGVEGNGDMGVTSARDDRDPIISCEGVRFSYAAASREAAFESAAGRGSAADGSDTQAPAPALDGIDLKVRPGEFLCVLGGNGSGKSTLARHLDALLVPDSGKVLVRGMLTADPRLVYDIRSTVGMVFQNPDDQLVATLVEDDVAFGPENLGIPQPELGERVRSALEEVGLTGFEKHETNALSGGQKQRVAIAGGLAMEPAVLILDEASAMLDPRGRAALMRVARELNARGMTIVMITHFMEEAAEADRVVVLEAGRVRLTGAPEDVLTRAGELSALNLDVPFACRLALALGERGVADLVPHVHEDAVVDEIASRLMPGEREFEGAAPAASPLSSSGPSAACGADAKASAADAKAPAETVLEFDHVWFSYDPPRPRKKGFPWSRRRVTGDRGASSPAVPAASAPDADRWGNAPDSAWALRDVTLAVRRGEMLGLAGHTGSGKSTLVQHMNGLEHPTRGAVRAWGEDLAGKRAAAAVKGRVGVVFQYPERQLFAPTVAEDVAFGPRNLGLSEDEVRARVERALRRVGLDASVAQANPLELSGGQQRRAALAGVLAMEPEVLVLDEPAAGLDPAGRRALIDLIRELHERGLTVVMVSHSMDDLAELCDRIVVLNDGSVALEGAPAEVFGHVGELRSLGLGLPAAQRMARALAGRGIPLDLRRLYTVETLADALAPLLAAAPAAKSAAGGESR